MMDLRLFSETKLRTIFDTIAHYEINRIKQMIFQLNKKVIYDSELSALLFRYEKGSNIYPSDLEPKIMQKILLYFYPSLKIKLNKKVLAFSNRTFTSFLTFEDMISLFGKPDFFRCDCSAVWKLLWKIEMTVNFLPKINNFIISISLDSGNVNFEIFTKCFCNEICHGYKKEKTIILIKPKITVTIGFTYANRIYIHFKRSETSIYKAVTEKNFRLIKKLITNTKSDLNILCGHYWVTPLMYAIRNNLSLRIIIFLMRYSDLAVTDWYDRDAQKLIADYRFNNALKFSLLAVFCKFCRFINKK